MEWDKIFTYTMFSSIMVELIKGLITLGFGYITFKVFQRYKNKEDNNKLYIEIIKAEAELIKNKKVLKDIKNQLIQIEFFEEDFMIKEQHTSELFQLFETINELQQIYIVENEITEYGDVVGSEYNYAEKPYLIIQDLKMEIANLDFSNKYMEDQERYSLEKQIELYENRSLFDDLRKIQKEIDLFTSTTESTFNKQLKFLLNKLIKYNNLNIDEKKKYLEKFCDYIFDGDNKFADSLRYFNTYIELEHKLSETKISTKFEFKLDLLAIYDAKSYIYIQEVSNKINNLEVNINYEEIECYNEVLNELINIIVDKKKTLKKTLSKTNRLFKGI